MSLFASLGRRDASLTTPAKTPTAAPAPSLAVAVACGRCGDATGHPADFPARGRLWSLCTACRATRTIAEIDGTPLALAVIRDALAVMLDPMERTHVEYAQTPGNCPADRLTDRDAAPDDPPGGGRWWWLDLAPLRLQAERFRGRHQPRRAPGGYPCADCGQSHAVVWHQGADGVLCDDCQHRRDNLPAGGDIAQDYAERLADVVMATILGREPVTFTAHAVGGKPGMYRPMPRAIARSGYGPTDRDLVPWHFVSSGERARLAAGWDAARPMAHRADRGGVVWLKVNTGRGCVGIDVPQGSDMPRGYNKRIKREAAQHAERCDQCREAGSVTVQTSTGTLSVPVSDG